MKFWKRLTEMHTANKDALETNRAVLESAEREAETVEVIRAQASQQAVKLIAANHRNHYSESLTHAFRGRPA